MQLTTQIMKFYTFIVSTSHNKDNITNKNIISRSQYCGQRTCPCRLFLTQSLELSVPWSRLRAGTIPTRTTFMFVDIFLSKCSYFFQNVSYFFQNVSYLFRNVTYFFQNVSYFFTISFFAKFASHVFNMISVGYSLTVPNDG